jgi:hypothetical protein
MNPLHTYYPILRSTLILSPHQCLSDGTIQFSLVLSPCNSVDDAPPCPPYTSTYYTTAAADCAYTVELQSTKDMHLHIEYYTRSVLFADLEEITCQ